MRWVLATLLCACSAASEPGQALSSTTVADFTTIPEYDRAEWHKRWLDADGDCQDTRQEVLIAESVTPVKLDDRGCRVIGGTWTDPYTGKVFSDPGQLDIDHMVALRNAHYSGGWMWGEERRKDFANDLSDPNTLIAVDRSANRSKGARGPDEWLPPSEEYRCDYVRIWLQVKDRWELTLTASEASAIAALRCPLEAPE